MTPEGLIKNQILDWLSYQPKCFFWPQNTTGVFDPVKKIYRKNRSRHHRNGVADILGIWWGKPLAIEVKSKRGVISIDQRRFLEDFQAHGGIAIVARSVEDVVKVLLKPEPIRID